MTTGRVCRPFPTGCPLAIDVPEINRDNLSGLMFISPYTVIA